MSDDFTSELVKLGKRVAELREYQNYTQEELAHKCKISCSDLIAIEHGVNVPFWKVCEVADGLNVNVQSLFSDEVLERPNILWCNPGDNLGYDLQK